MTDDQIRSAIATVDLLILRLSGIADMPLGIRASLQRTRSRLVAERERRGWRPDPPRRPHLRLVK